MPISSGRPAQLHLGDEQGDQCFYARRCDVRDFIGSLRQTFEKFCALRSNGGIENLAAPFACRFSVP